MFQYISFRAGIAAILALLIATLSGKRIIGLLYRLQVGETVRDLGLEGQKEKSGTPTMGGDYHYFGFAYSGAFTDALG